MLLEIITPEKIIYKEEVLEVVAPTVNGQISILPHHVGLLTKLISGELIVKKGATQQIIAVTGGFLEVGNNNISILADYAIRAEDIEVEKAQEAKKRAEALMEEKISEQDEALIEAQLRRALLELKVARKHKLRQPQPLSP